MQNTEMDLYTDYLLSSFGAATATGLSQMVDGAVSHDKVTRFLSGRDYTSKDLWMQVKGVIRQAEDETGVVIFDDTIQEKMWTDESDQICWHYDHCLGRTIKGLNLLNALYHCKGRSIPVAFELVRKPLQDQEAHQLADARAGANAAAAVGTRQESHASGLGDGAAPAGNGNKKVWSACQTSRAAEPPPSCQSPRSGNWWTGPAQSRCHEPRSKPAMKRLEGWWCMSTH